VGMCGRTQQLHSVFIFTKLMCVLFVALYA
jgi:hypothetical protein